MKIRTVKIWLSKGWYYAVYSVSLMLVTLIASCSSSRSSAKSNVSNGETVANSNILDSYIPFFVSLFCCYFYGGKNFNRYN